MSDDPRVTRSRAAALDAARELFLAEGYDGATLDAVAARAGLARRTLYNLYDNKDALFRAVIGATIEIAERFTASLVDDVRGVSDVAVDLPAVAVRLAEATLLGTPLALRRLLIMEAGRVPDLVAEYRARAPEAVMSALAELFGTMRADGLLDVADIRLAAEHFAFLVMGADLDRGTFTGERPSRRRVRDRARTGAAVFLRAYASPSPRTSPRPARPTTVDGWSGIDQDLGATATGHVEEDQ